LCLDFAWQVPLGVNEALPEGKRNTGSPGAGGPMATAGGLYLSVRPATIASGPSIQKTGKELWASKLDYNLTAVPITYQGEDGRQC